MKVLTEEQREARLTRLAAWARDEIISCRKRIESLNAKIEELTSEYPDTNVKVSGRYVYPDKTLPPNSEVAFKLTDRDWDYIRIRHDLHDDGLLRLTGSGQLVIKSVSSNVIEVSIYDRNRV